MTDYISREAALESLLGWAAQLTETYGKNDEYVRCLESAAYNIEQIPAADVRPVVRAEFVRCGDGKGVPYMCSHCGRTTPANMVEIWGVNFCPNCGADMREPPEEGEA